MKAWIEGLLVSAVAVFAPIQGIVVTVGVLILSDAVTGVWAAKKTGQKITSAGFTRTLAKFFVYQLAVLMGYLLQKYLINDLIPAVNIVAGAIGITEFKSMLENSSKIVGQDVLKLILSKLGSQNDQLTDEAKKLLKETEQPKEP